MRKGLHWMDRSSSGMGPSQGAIVLLLDARGGVCSSPNSSHTVQAHTVSDSIPMSGDVPQPPPSIMIRPSRDPLPLPSLGWYSPSEASDLGNSKVGRAKITVDAEATATQVRAGWTLGLYVPS